MCGDYQMYKQTSKNNCNLAIRGARCTEGLTTPTANDSASSDLYSGVDIVGVDVYGPNEWNTSNVTNTGSVYDHVSPTFGIYYDNNQQYVAFKCRQFSNYSSSGVPAKEESVSFLLLDRVWVVIWVFTVVVFGQSIVMLQSIMKI